MAPDRPVPTEIEITPAMISGGREGLAGFNEEFETREERVEIILRTALIAAGYCVKGGGS